MPLINKCDYLVIESTTWSPHLETAGEISLIEQSRGNKVVFCFLRIDNPDEYWSWKQNILFASRYRKVAMLEDELNRRGIAIINSDTFGISAFSRKYCDDVDSNIRFFKYKNANLGRGIYSSIISKYATIDPFSLTNIKSTISRYVNSSLMAYDMSVNLIKNLWPKKIIVFNGRFAISNAICEAANYCKIPVMYHERGANINRYYYSAVPIHNIKERGVMMLDAWNSAGSDRDEVARSFFEKRRSGDGIGWYSFVNKQKRNNFPCKNRRRYTFFSSSEDEYEALGNYFNHFLFSSQREAITYLIDYFKNRVDAELVIRVHPHLAMRSSTDAKWWNSLCGPNVSLIPSESVVDSYALLDSSDVVLSYGSTMGVEAVYWKKPSVLLGDSPLFKSGCFYEPEDIYDLNLILCGSSLECADQCTVYPYGFYYMTFGDLYKYYSPIDFGSGLFLNKKLDIYPKFISNFMSKKI